MSDYKQFIGDKTHLSGNHGFKPVFMPEFLFPFQKFAVEWLVRKGRGELMFDVGLGKGPMMMTWAQNIAQKTNGRVLLLAPLGVSFQFVGEAEKFGIEVELCRDGKFSPSAKLVITNYQQLGKFDSKDFVGVACDESSILKNFDGKIKADITDFMRKMKYRSLYTATAAPNDFPEFGTSSEALGEMGYMDMLGMFFKNAQNSLHPSIYRNRGSNFQLQDESGKWRFRGHAEKDFWRWVSSWLRAARKPSDLGEFSDDGYILPPLKSFEHIVKAGKSNPEFLIDMPAVGLREQRDERRRSLTERCDLAAQIADSDPSPCVSWCELNPEGDLLEKLIPDAIQISGKDSDEAHDEKIKEFIRRATTGQRTRLITKSSICGFGLNLQCCWRTTHFASHSFERYKQSNGRFRRFGQTHEVESHMIASEGERGVLKNLLRKAEQTENLYSNLVALINDELKIEKKAEANKKQKLPSWI
jgi:hypothetical protein